MTVTNRGSGSLVTSTAASSTPSESGVTGSANGDIQFLLVGQNTTEPGATLSLSANATGWTRLGFAEVLDGAQPWIAALYVGRRGQTAGMPTITSSQTGAGIFAKLYQVADSDPTAAGVQFWEGAITQVIAANDANSTAPSVTTTGPNRLVLAFHAIQDNETVSAPGGSWSNWGTSGSATGNDGTLAAERLVMATAGASGPSARSKVTNDPAVTFAVAVYSAADAPVAGALVATPITTGAPSLGAPALVSTFPVSPISGDGSEALSPLVNIGRWKLELPVDAQGNVDGGTDGLVLDPIPEGYESVPFFDTLTTGELSFLTPADGCRIGSTNYPRSELRELNADGSLAAWYADDGKAHRLSARIRVEREADLAGGGKGRLVFGQVHGSGDELCRVYWDNGELYYHDDQHEVSPGEHQETRFYLLDGANAHTAIPLGDDFDYQIAVSGGTLTVTAVHDGVTYSNSSAISSIWDGDPLNFKAGNYLQVGKVGGGATNQGAGHSVVVFSRLDVPVHAHALTASNLAAGMPALGAPALTIEAGSLVADDLAAGAPTLGVAAIGQVHLLVPVAVSTAAPVLDAAGLAQQHALAASGTTSGAPELEAPAIGQVHGLSAASLSGQAPALDHPMLGQGHVLDGTAIVAGSPSLGSPAAGQVHVLYAGGIASGGPALSAPLLGAEPGTAHLATNDVDAGVPAVGAPTLGQRHDLTAAILSTAAPSVAAPALGQRHGLAGNDIAAQAPKLGTPTIETQAPVYALVATGLTVAPISIGTPSLGQVHTLVSPGLVTGVPTLSLPGLDRPVRRFPTLGGGSVQGATVRRNDMVPAVRGNRQASGTRR